MKRLNMKARMVLWPSAALQEAGPYGKSPNFKLEHDHD